MRLTFTKEISLRLLVALSAAGMLLATSAIGCGDDDTDDNAGGADASAAGKGGKGGKAGNGGGGGNSGSTAGNTTGRGGRGETGGTVIAPTTPEECKAAIKRDSPEDSDARADCLCDKCFDDWVPCMMDEGCKLIMRCARDRGCSDQYCAWQKCPEVINQYAESIPLSDPLATCNKKARCDKPNAADSGLADSGATDSGL